MVSIELTFLEKLWFFLPAAVANAAPVFSRHRFFSRLKNPPLDLWAKLPDGKRVFGDGKTFLGTFLGLFFGTFLGLLQGSLITGFLISLGALLGDLVGAFVKRRLGFERGRPVFLLDQLDFVAGAFLFTSRSFFNWTLLDFALISILAIPLHRLSGIIGYKLKVKREPW